MEKPTTPECVMEAAKNGWIYETQRTYSPDGFEFAVLVYVDSSAKPCCHQSKEIDTWALWEENRGPFDTYLTSYCRVR